MFQCNVCGQDDADIRIRTDQGCYGPVDIQTCRTCHEKEMNNIRAENRRFGFKEKTKKWDKLTTKGLYSEVR
jgi:hypothetical protein